MKLLRGFFVGLFVGLALVILSAQATKISTSGTLPANCTVGNAYVKTGASAGFYVCLATNTWTGPMSTSGGASLDTLAAAAAQDATRASGNNYGQLFNWALTTNNKSAIAFGETTAATSGTADNQIILGINTLASSTAVPLYVKNYGTTTSFRVDDVSGDTTPFTIDDTGYVGIHSTAVSGVDLNIRQVGSTSLQMTDATATFQAAANWDSACRFCVGTSSNHTFGFFSNNTTAGYFTTNQSLVLQKNPSTTLTNASAGTIVMGSENFTNGAYRSVCAGYAASATYSPVCFGYVQTNNGGNTYGDFFIATRNSTSDATSVERMRVKADGTVSIEDLKNTGAATGKNVVCVDTATGLLYASSTGVDCSN